MENTENTNRVNEVYEVFKEFFGEENVDLQYRDDFVLLYNIITYFEKVTVTNEYDESTEVTDLYIKTNIDNHGYIQGKFTMTRGSYTFSQVLRNYMHSHAVTIPSDDYKFVKVCIGSGPINSTIAKLSIDYDLDIWRLYCYELSKFVQVESIAGVPYQYLSRLSKTNKQSYEIALNFDRLPYINCNINNHRELLCDFIQFYIENLDWSNLKVVNYRNKLFFNKSDKELISEMSTLFKQFLLQEQINYQDLLPLNICFQGTYLNNKNIFEATTSISISNNISTNKIACKFKGHDIYTKIIYDIEANNRGNYLILNPQIVYWITNIILNKISYARDIKYTKTDGFYKKATEFEKKLTVL